MYNTLNKMKGFRNILVHKYGIVDDEEVFEMLSERLSDFDAFKEAIIHYVKSNESKNKRNEREC